MLKKRLNLLILASCLCLSAMPFSFHQLEAKTSTKPKEKKNKKLIRSHDLNLKDSHSHVQKLKATTTWEAPTKEDLEIKEKIEKAQINYGPTSKEAGQLMLKYAKRYYEQKNYERARLMAEEMIKLDKIESIEGISMNEVTKIRAQAMSNLKLVPQYKRRKYKTFKSVLRQKPRYRRPSHIRHYHSPVFQGGLMPKTSVGKVVNKRSGVTEIDYSDQAIQEARRITQSYKSNSKQAKYRQSPSYSPVYRYRSRQSSSSMFGNLGPYRNMKHYLDQHNQLRKLGSNFKKYK